MISPVPTEPVPVYVGGHADAGLRRAASIGDGWISVNTTTEAIGEAISKLATYRAEAGRADDPFAISVLAIDAFDVDGYRRLEDMGVTHAQVVPWYFYGGDPEDLQTKRDSLFKFADDVMAQMGERL
jgi:alkanesulfonate monooxygenase SsuD/methylene tetrahydromethanopterin reductase-like flavin-dependent oxidoreductase (luciferase family)